MITFVKPQCPPCLEFGPLYETLANKMENEDIDFFKMDAINNEVPRPFVIQSYPDIYFLKRGMKLNSPFQYNGGRRLKSLIAFIAEHSTKPLKGFYINGDEKASDL